MHRLHTHIHIQYTIYNTQYTVYNLQYTSIYNIFYIIQYTIYMYIYIYIYTSRHTFRHTDIQIYTHINIQTYRHTDLQTHRDTYIHTYIHAYINTYTHIYIYISSTRSDIVVYAHTIAQFYISSAGRRDRPQSETLVTFAAFHQPILRALSAHPVLLLAHTEKICFQQGCAEKNPMVGISWDWDGSSLGFG